jgi:hypothetical protein
LCGISSLLKYKCRRDLYAPAFIYFPIKVIYILHLAFLLN